MSDIVERLRAWVYPDSLYATAREAADEIERLRLSASGDFPEPENAANSPPDPRSGCGECLTDAEREAVEVAAAAYAEDHGERFAATLRGLLSRQNPPATDRP